MVKTLRDILSPSQLRLAGLVGEGCSNKEIASTVNTSLQVVKNNLHTIFDLAGVWSRHELAVRFIRESEEQARCILQQQHHKDERHAAEL